MSFHFTILLVSFKNKKNYNHERWVIVFELTNILTIQSIIINHSNYSNVFLRQIMFAQPSFALLFELR